MQDEKNEESKRLDEQKGVCFVRPWEKWGPYVSERQWGTVREDYSADGNAWNSFPHEQARSRAYRWGEDGIAGFCDRYQVLCLAHAFWNGRDSILKERLFGLTPDEGNHGEDVKELYYYLDALPSHAYLKYLYKYPQLPYPYEELVRENRKRSTNDREYELIDTGLFDEDRYFDIFIEYAKIDHEDWVVRIEAMNRGPDPAPLHIVPHLWFRNQWSWGDKEKERPKIVSMDEGDGFVCLEADDAPLERPPTLIYDYHLGKRYLYAENKPELLFTENESNRQALWKTDNPQPYVKDAFHRYLIEKDQTAVHPGKKGSKAALHYFFEAIAPGQSEVVHLRLSPKKQSDPIVAVADCIEKRKKEADLFYEGIHPKGATDEEKQIQRQAFAGMIWSKQFYYYDVGVWLQGDNEKKKPPIEREEVRNNHWRHVNAMVIFSMPDKWEYPWFAAWDLTFHCVVFSQIDLLFAKEQLWLLLFDRFQHPNGSVPAYEWEFSDINPPVQAWAVLKVFEREKEQLGEEDFEFLEKCFHKLLLNFSWWVNRVDAEGNNVFEGGFLGMDNVSFVDRSKPPKGVQIDEVDAAGWMSLLCLNLMRIALYLAKKNPVYESLALKFFSHFLYVTAAMRKGYWRPYDMWNEEDGFFYGSMKFPDGKTEHFPAKTVAGLIPFLAFDVWDEEELKEYPEFYEAVQWIMKEKPHLVSTCIQEICTKEGKKHLLGLLNPDEIIKMMKNLWDPKEFRSDFGLRSVSKIYQEHPVNFFGSELRYEPGESLEKIKGGNSNWRGPIWFPINFLLFCSLKQLGSLFQEELQVQVGEEKAVEIGSIADSFAERLLAIFKRNEEGRRPLFGDVEKYQRDPHFKDFLFFNEHFHGDTGRGLGASHQNGWTGLIANLIESLRKDS